MIDDPVLMGKYEQDGVNPCQLRWLSSFVCERKQGVRNIGFASSIVTLNGAVPNGAILGLESCCQMIRDMKSRIPTYKTTRRCLKQ